MNEVEWRNVTFWRNGAFFFYYRKVLRFSLIFYGNYEENSKIAKVKNEGN
jgi:hypothetical protein